MEDTGGFGSMNEDSRCINLKGCETFNPLLGPCVGEVYFVAEYRHGDDFNLIVSHRCKKCGLRIQREYAAELFTLDEHKTKEVIEA